MSLDTQTKAGFDKLATEIRSRVKSTTVKEMKVITGPPPAPAPGNAGIIYIQLPTP